MHFLHPPPTTPASPPSILLRRILTLEALALWQTGGRLTSVNSKHSSRTARTKRGPRRHPCRTQGGQLLQTNTLSNNISEEKGKRRFEGGNNYLRRNRWASIQQLASRRTETAGAARLQQHHHGHATPSPLRRTAGVLGGWCGGTRVRGRYMVK